MIFDCDHVTKLVGIWQQKQDEGTLIAILDGCLHLVEAIVSKYDPIYRDDLKQESFLRIQYSLKYFDSNISSLHNYLTTVIINACNTFMSKQSRLPMDDMELDPDVEPADLEADYSAGEDMLTELRVRNRNRFPSLPVEEIDGVTDTIYYYVMDTGCKSRSLITKLSSQYNMPRQRVSIIYTSTLIYLKNRYASYSTVPLVGSDEFSIIEDLRELVGDYITSKIITAFSGTTLKIP